MNQRQVKAEWWKTKALDLPKLMFLAKVVSYGLHKQLRDLMVEWKAIFNNLKSNDYVVDIVCKAVDW